MNQIGTWRYPITKAKTKTSNNNQIIASSVSGFENYFTTLFLGPLLMCLQSKGCVPKQITSCINCEEIHLNKRVQI
jgi:hypothetical protein